MQRTRYSALLVALHAALLTGLVSLGPSYRVEAQTKQGMQVAKQVLKKRNARVSSRYDIIDEDTTLIGVRLPPPWDTILPQPRTAEFYKAHDAAFEILIRALFPKGFPAPTSVKAPLPGHNAIESFQSVPHVFRLHNLQPDAIPELRKDANVLFVSNEPGVVSIDTTTNKQNNFINPKQINLDNPGDIPFTDVTGITQRSVAGIDIESMSSWKWGIGSPDVVVAIIDDSFDLTKPELKDSIYTNTGEIPCNGIDDDRNGYVDDVNGYNVPLKTGCVKTAQNKTAHGTSMALTIVAPFRRPSNESIVGIAPGVRLLPLHLDNNFTNIDEAYSYILAMKRRGIPIRVVNLSLGFPVQNPALLNEQCGLLRGNAVPTPLLQVLRSGVTIVAAAGNEGKNNDTSPVCPGNYASVHPNVVTVAAVDPAGKHPFFSNFGKISVTLSAPGSAVYTGYGYSSGTSIAAAHVSGIVALMYSIDSSLTASEVKEILIASTKHPELNLPTATRGIVSAHIAMTTVANRVREKELRRAPQ